jgi:hypothetical protein
MPHPSSRDPLSQIRVGRNEGTRARLEASTGQPAGWAIPSSCEGRHTDTGQDVTPTIHQDPGASIASMACWFGACQKWTTVLPCTAVADTFGVCFWTGASGPFLLNNRRRRRER